MLGEVLFGFLVGCISVLWFLLTARHEGGDDDALSEPRAPAAARDACTAVFERLLEDVSRSDELRVLLEGKLQRALNPLSASTSMLKMVTLTGLRYPHFRPRLANITQTPTEHADELRVEFDLWTEGTVTLMLRAVVQGGILPSMPVDLVLSIRSIRARARLIIPPGRDPTLYLSFTSPPRLDMRVEAGRVRVEKLPYVGKALLERVHQLINRHLVAPSGGIAFHFPIPKVRKLRFRMLSAPPPPLPPRVSPSASTADASVDAAAASPMQVLAEEREESVATRVSAALTAETDAAAPLAPALLTSTLPVSPPPVPARLHSSALASVPIPVPLAEASADATATPATDASADPPLSALPLATAAQAVDATPAASANAPLPALPLAAAEPAAVSTLPVVVLAPARPASPPAPPSLSSSALFGPRSPTTTSAVAAVGTQPIPVPLAEPLSSSSPPTAAAAAASAASVPAASASASLFSSLPLSEAPPPPVPARLRSESLFASGSVMASASVTALPAPVSDEGAHSPAVPPRSLRPQLSRRLPEEAEAEAEAEERRLVAQGSASLLAAEARLQPETQLNIGRFVVDEYDASPSTSPPAVPPRPHAAPPPLPPRPSSFQVDD